MYLCFISRVCQCTPCFWELAFVFTICIVFELMYAPIFVGKVCEKNMVRLMIVGALMYVSHLSGNHWQAGTLGLDRSCTLRFGEKSGPNQVEQRKKGPNGCLEFFGGWNTTQLCGDCFMNHCKEKMKV